MSTVAMDPRLRARRIEVMRLQGRRRLRLLVGTAATLVAAMAIFALTRSPLLDVDTIVVEGASPESEIAVRQMAEPLISKPLLELNIKGVEDQIVGLPWVEGVWSDRSWDGTVTFRLTERVPVAALASTEGWLLVDPEGRVLEKAPTVPSGIVAVDGVAWRAELGEWVPERALTGIEVAAALPAGLAGELSSVRLGASPEEGILLILDTGGTVVLGPVVDLDQKFVSAATIIEQVSLRCVDRIDVRAPTVPVLTRDRTCS